VVDIHKCMNFCLCMESKHWMNYHVLDFDELDCPDIHEAKSPAKSLFANWFVEADTLFLLFCISSSSFLISGSTAHLISFVHLRNPILNLRFSINFGIPTTMTSVNSANRIIGFLKMDIIETIHTHPLVPNH
jgi:hypothetical protein